MFYFTDRLVKKEHLKQNPFFLDIMLRRLLLRAVLFKEAAGEKNVIADPTYTNLLHGKVDAFPEWLFKHIEEDDYDVLDEDSAIGLEAHEHVNGVMQSQELNQDLIAGIDTASANEHKDY